MERFDVRNLLFYDGYDLENELLENLEDGTKKEIIQDILFNVFDTKNYDMGSKNIKGNFGKHIIMSPKLLTLNESIKMIETILKEIDMTPITKMIINKKDDFNFDILQPIAESHISFHRHNDEMIIDAFSCKYFDEQKLLRILNQNSDNFVQVNRGIRYK